MSETVTLEILRFDPSMPAPKLVHYVVPYKKGMTVLEALFLIEKQNRDAPVFRHYKCNRGQCGSCAMTINGKIQKTCSVPIESGSSVRIEPIKTLPLVRDLVVKFGQGRVGIKEESCASCLLCIKACPTGAFTLSGKLNKKGQRVVEASREGVCIACKACEKACPFSAISIYGY